MFPKSSAEHVRPISLVLQCLLQHSLFVKTEKSKLHASFVPFLGYILGQGVVKIDPALVEAVAKWPASVSWEKVERFLGFVNIYRHFIRNYGKIVTPLTALTLCKIPFQWSDPTEQAFQHLKKTVLHSINPWPEVAVCVGGRRFRRRSGEHLDSKRSQAPPILLSTILFGQEKLWNWEPRRGEDGTGGMAYTILPASHLVALLSWVVEEKIWWANQEEKGPRACPADRLYVPETAVRGTTIK